jgi:hypothetical protein
MEPPAAPQARPAQTIHLVNDAVGRIEVLQQQQEE